MAHLSKKLTSLTSRLNGDARLLVFSLALLAAGLGCATFTVVSEVTRNEDGSHTGALKTDIEIEPGVYRALIDLNPESAGEWPMAAQARQTGWTVSQEGSRLRMSRQLNSLEAFQSEGMPALAGLAEEGGFPITAMNITVDEPEDEPPVYEYTATVVIPKQEESTEAAPAQAGGDAFSQSLASAIAEAVDKALDDPEIEALEKAVEKAGPAKVIVTAALPGNIEEATVNGQPQGAIADDRVTWTISFADAGTYSLRAVAKLGYKVELIDFAESYTQGDDFKVRGRVTEKADEPVKDAEVQLEIKGPKEKPYGTPKSEPLKTDADGYFEWHSYFTADASVGAWNIVAKAKKAKKSGKGRREFKVDKLELTESEVDANIQAIIKRWQADPSIPTGMDQPFVAALRPFPNYGVQVNLVSWVRKEFEPYTCSALAIDTLRFLNRLRFSENKDERLLMGGVHYGPVTDGTGLIHVAVALYPAANTVREWMSGTILEPWANQRKEAWPWALWAAAFLGGSEAETILNLGNMWEGEYPTSGSGGGYYPSLQEEPATLQGKKAMAVLTYSPVELLITDADGRQVGRPDGSVVNEIPGADQAHIKLDDGTQANLIELPEGEYDVTVRATGDGEFHLETTNGQQLLGYGEQPIRSGQEAQLKLNSADLEQPLTLPDGKTVMPEPVAVSAGSRLSSRTLVLGLVGLLAVVALLAFVLKRQQAGSAGPLGGGPIVRA